MPDSILRCAYTLWYTQLTWQVDCLSSLSLWYNTSPDTIKLPLFTLACSKHALRLASVTVAVTTVIVVRPYDQTDGAFQSSHSVSGASIMKQKTLHSAVQQSTHSHHTLSYSCPSNRLYTHHCLTVVRLRNSRSVPASSASLTTSASSANRLHIW